MACFLVDDTALFENLCLTTDLIGQTVMKILEGIHVLELGLRTQLRLASTAQAHVTIAAKRSFFHRAVRDSDCQIDLTQLLHEQTGFFGCAQIRLRDKLDERRAAAIVIDERMGCASDTTFTATNVDHLARILFHMNTLDANMGNVTSLFLGLFQIDALLRCRAVHFQVEMSAHAECDGALCGLEVLRHIGVHIVLAIEHRVFLDLTVSCKPRQHDRFNGRTIRNRQRSWQT